MAKIKNFNGRQIHIPGSYTRTILGGLNTPSIPGNNIVIMGSSGGGPVNELIFIQNYQQAIAVLKSGALLDACYQAFINTSVPSTGLFVVRSNNATSASVNVMSTSPSPNAVITVTTIEKGITANNHILTVRHNATTNILTVISGDGITPHETATVSTIGATIVRTGTPTANITITNTGISIDSSTYNYSDYETIGDIVNAINSLHANITITLNERIDVNTPSKFFDTLPSTAIPVSSATPLVLNASVYFADILIRSTGLYTTTILNNAKRNITSSTFFLIFNGGTNGDYEETQWNATLSYLLTKNISVLIACNATVGLNNLLIAHVKNANSTLVRKERMGILYSPNGTTNTYAAAKELSSTAASHSLIVVYKKSRGYTRLSPEDLTTLESDTFAFQIAGMMSGEGITQTITTNSIPDATLDMDDILTNTIESVKDNVVIPYDNGENNIILRGLTTHPREQLQYNEITSVRIIQTMAITVRRLLDNYIGTTGLSAEIITSVTNDVTALLNSFIPLTYINGWSGLSVTIDQDVIRVSYDASVIVPFNFSFITTRISI